jgi:outer membrane cobalamin receptor
MRADYYSYTMNKLEYPWQRPTYKFGFYSSYKMFDKVLLTANLIAQGGAKAYDNETNKVVTLKSALNLEGKVRYFISKPISVYVEVNNALNNKYPIYQFYQARGIMVSAGLSWSF